MGAPSRRHPRRSQTCGRGRAGVQSAGDAGGGAVVKTEYSNLDFLRAVAVTLVTVCHTIKFFFGLGISEVWGLLGVSIFFVHTSLVLTQSLDHQSGPLFIPFMIRRCFRIYPVAILMLAIAVLFRVPQHGIAVGHLTAEPYGALDIVANLFLAQELSRNGFSIVGPMWSLSAEMLMYVVLPILFVLANRGRRVIPVALLYLAVVLLSTVGVSHFPQMTIFTYAPVFTAGMISYYLLRSSRPVIPAFVWPIALCVVCFILLIPAVSSRLQFLWWNVGIAVAIPLFRQITSRPLVVASKLIARYSYGIYITHCLCMWLALEKMPGPAPVRFLAFFVLLAIVSVALYHGIEEPLIKFGKRVAARYVEERKQRERTPVIYVGEPI
jgi:peptidoglycan/LPS O-acetylase OafA/YrhL